MSSFFRANKNTFICKEKTVCISTLDRLENFGTLRIEATRATFACHSCPPEASTGRQSASLTLTWATVGQSGYGVMISDQKVLFKHNSLFSSSPRSTVIVNIWLWLDELVWPIIPSVNESGDSLATKHKRRISLSQVDCCGGKSLLWSAVTTWQLCKMRSRP